MTTNYVIIWSNIRISNVVITLKTCTIDEFMNLHREFTSNTGKIRIYQHGCHVTEKAGNMSSIKRRLFYGCQKKAVFDQLWWPVMSKLTSISEQWFWTTWNFVLNGEWSWNDHPVESRLSETDLVPKYLLRFRQKENVRIKQYYQRKRQER